MPRLLWMDRLRGAAILAVVLFHAELQAVGATGDQLPVVHAVNGVVGPVRMPMLVLLSGMLLAPALRKPRSRYVDGKLRTLLWPYLVWSALDLAQLQWRLVQAGESLDWPWVARVLYDPPTYLWFLAFLLVYYLVAMVLPAPARTAAAPVALGLAVLVPEDWQRLVWLFGWFLTGDVLGRLVLGRLAPRVSRGVDPLAYVGRSSIVFYVSHLVVAIFVTDRLTARGVDDALPVFLACVVVPLAVGWALVEARRHPAVAALFEWPFGARRSAALRSSGAHDRTAQDRSLRPAG
ncbi:hypothetical protein DDE18_10905 [Nocardioides gansuensis]|uniref:Acyltransferase 3 domain-containing protein n=1 Tax=Nocardioides gansuensis TaxID=2138300 RepID=A0A2T8FAZ4_9ACTN|nr:acyltransferase family protein [Nocardioides gansuensis]PVG82857.1 hypothetical protein DDE18_10905 [Nocardioides gansuensis]